MAVVFCVTTVNAQTSITFKKNNKASSAKIVDDEKIADKVFEINTERKLSVNDIIKINGKMWFSYDGNGNQTGRKAIGGEFKVMAIGKENTYSIQKIPCNN